MRHLIVSDLKTRFQRFFLFITLFLSQGCYVHYKIDEADRLVPKNPKWSLENEPREGLERLDFNAVYIGESPRGYWMVRFWPTGQIKTFDTSEMSDWEWMKRRNGGTIGYYSLDENGVIQIEYMSYAAQGTYVVAYGLLRKDGTIVFDGEDRGRRYRGLPGELKPEIEIDNNDSEWDWTPDW
ncbi:hypothetical protein J3R74_001984 [Puniceicoccus vermicola]|uniref:Lipoprotein n=1 Tax=Puniceicoccus vermicola TaxID=388746 RepID=A0A7X1AV47_9BACT|nr:hypothetical protein [Puniceicoccus vermicola]